MDRLKCAGNVDFIPPPHLFTEFLLKADSAPYAVKISKLSLL